MCTSRLFYVFAFTSMISISSAIAQNVPLPPTPEKFRIIMSIEADEMVTSSSLIRTPLAPLPGFKESMEFSFNSPKNGKLMVLDSGGIVLRNRNHVPVSLRLNTSSVANATSVVDQLRGCVNLAAQIASISPDDREQFHDLVFNIQVEFLARSFDYHKDDFTLQQELAGMTALSCSFFKRR